MKWIWVSLPYATFGIAAKDGVIVETADIGRWMIGKDTKFIRKWIASKGGTWKLLEEK